MTKSNLLECRANLFLFPHQEDFQPEVLSDYYWDHPNVYVILVGKTNPRMHNHSICVLFSVSAPAFFCSELLFFGMAFFGMVFFGMAFFWMVFFEMVFFEMAFLPFFSVMYVVCVVEQKTYTDFVGAKHLEYN